MILTNVDKRIYQNDRDTLTKGKSLQTSSYFLVQTEIRSFYNLKIVKYFYLWLSKALLNVLYCVCISMMSNARIKQ